MTLYPKLITDALATVSYPGTKKNLIESEMLADNMRIDGMNVSFSLIFPRDTDPFLKSTVKAAEAAIHYHVSPEVKVTITTEFKSKPRPEVGKMLPQVKNVVAVSSGKGGVGKSTVAVNLAISLAKTGASVGLIDADIYGPSVPIMFNLGQEDVIGQEHDGKTYMLPIERYGVKLMSIGFLVDPDRALAWRGPMASGALKQLATDTWWGEIDYLVVDMPPGTGDVQLTLAQTLPVTGAIIVSTPQQVALADVVRGVELFRNPGLNIPVLGFVENMAYFTPAELPDHKYFIFGKEGCKRLAAEMGVPLLGEIPLVQSIAESGDSGKPVSLWSDTETPESKAFMQLAENTIREICKLQGK